VSRLALCSIQKNRAPWLAEWVVFHALRGVSKFYLYLHGCTDESLTVAGALRRHFDLEVVVIAQEVMAPQLKAYNHCYATQGHKHDWIGFLDGDEFLFSPKFDDIGSVLEQYKYQRLSALAVYWAIFGSSAHKTEPRGLLIENFTRCATVDFEANTHIKSIVAGGQGDVVKPVTAHHFKTIYGTFDTAGREISWGYTQNTPDYSQLRINHYVTQSLEYFVKSKSISGKADISPLANRDLSWFHAHDRNEAEDHSIRRFSHQVEQTLRSIDLFERFEYAP